MKLFNSQKYEEAYKVFVSLNYKDSADKATECAFLKQKAGLAKEARITLYESTSITWISIIKTWRID